jgi:hypothetical protein
MLVAFLIQLSVHWSVVVFETHAERGDTHEDENEKRQEYELFPPKETRSTLVRLFDPLLGPGYLL